MLKKSKRGQLTIFVIVGILLVAGITTFLLIKNKTSFIIPSDFQQVEDKYLSCIEETAKIGINTLEIQGGYIELPKFEPGNKNIPFSNMLDYSGTGIPYWYYVSAGNLIKTQVPSKKNMEEQLANFIDENLKCDFSEFEEKDFKISLNKSKTEVKILNNKIEITLQADLIISREDKTIKISSHKKNINSNLGNFYEDALKIYNKEKEESFLENYTLDILYSYAPVNGIEFSCSPKVWNLDNITSEIKLAIENNFIFIKGSNIKRENKELDKYFTININTKNDFRILYSKEWITKLENKNSKNNMLIAEPIGLQQGMGLLGFCILNYHYVYDLTFPVLIQIYNEEEFFQFPILVIIKGNNPKEAIKEAENIILEEQICKYRTQDLKVYTYDSNLNPVEADISFKCLNEICDLGKTKIKGIDAILETKVPNCINGILTAKAEGYGDSSDIISTNEEDEAYIMLRKKYPVNLKIESNNKDITDNAIIYFVSNEENTVIYYPYQKSFNLTEGMYNITVYVYKNTSINIPESKTEKCVEVPSSVIGGIFGITKKECYDVVIPAQTINNVVIGGGKLNQYVTESELEAGRIKIDVGSLKVPSNLEELQEIYYIIESNPLNLEAK
ncbi:MAG: hypothetical protein QW117_00865 [Candidatus Pacearchaeota archaeon]